MSFEIPADRVHQYEQLGADLRQLAHTMSSFFFGLIEDGFTREEALFIVRDWQGHSWHHKTLLLLNDPDDEDDPF